MSNHKYSPESINLVINEVEPFSNENASGVTIYWSSDIGFGQYVLICRKSETGRYEWSADTECMDGGDDKAFGQALLSLWMKQIQIIG